MVVAALCLTIIRTSRAGPTTELTLKSEVSGNPPQIVQAQVGSLRHF